MVDFFMIYLVAVRQILMNHEFRPICIPIYQSQD